MKNNINVERLLSTVEIEEKRLMLSDENDCCVMVSSSRSRSKFEAVTSASFVNTKFVTEITNSHPLLGRLRCDESCNLQSLSF